MERETKIYVLRDPRTNAVRYVGKTVQSLARRLNAHILRSAAKRTHRDCWISGLTAAGLRPIIECIATAGADWIEREQFWIAHYRATGCDLTNQTDGGEGTPGIEFSESFRRQLSERQTARMTPEYRKRLSEKVKDGWTPERRAAWAKKMSERQTPEERARRSKLANSPEMLALNRAKQIEVWTPERRAARSAQVRAQMTPERIEAHAEKLRKTTSSPEWKAKHSISQRAKWTPEMRAAQAERTKAQFAAKRAALESGPK
ncbi:GIY-YIG nuclease family protein [Burkholderia sp. B21-005]|uniref:GIY-YIG nuclease family protein n=1 Tax=Burkholderia sp. B21-005 TaxID=2890406 RepID=UPI001588E554|nr:GIY-YIG nuclease family protein [Burkholderia sp. B21-005]UEP42750.1 GIY-YIG nuclease family protein [Burkholderia sp. B21-005]